MHYLVVSVEIRILGVGISRNLLGEQRTQVNEEVEWPEERLDENDEESLERSEVGIDCQPGCLAKKSNDEAQKIEHSENGKHGVLAFRQSSEYVSRFTSVLSNPNDSRILRVDAQKLQSLILALGARSVSVQVHPLTSDDPTRYALPHRDRLALRTTRDQRSGLLGPDDLRLDTVVAHRSSIGNLEG